MYQGFSDGDLFVNVVSGLGGLFAALIFTVPSYFFLMNGVALAINFQHLSNDLRMSIRGEDGTLAVRSLEWFRLRHSQLCTLLEVADGIFAPWICLTLVCSTVQVLAAIFGFYADSDVQVATAVSGVYWLLSYFFQMAVTLLTGAIVHEAAHEPLKFLYQLDQAKMDIPEALQLQTFLNKLTCNRIGFTAWKIFPINKEAFLLVFGTYVTYQILLFELQLDLGLDAQMDEVGFCLQLHDSKVIASNFTHFW
ncbi:hypothetical protein BV898_01186 [Hypsibius exemplaris]|uniref:Gustatory receptor n=1 Tax=Hypsibius exemplaris TaxID=2072580 RepID=A0A1W0XBU3_HYPEX|nr:hypothetical protein BV898_01186 [Hypsibius exemplaris]